MIVSCANCGRQISQPSDARCLCGVPLGEGCSPSINSSDSGSRPVGDKSSDDDGISRYALEEVPPLGRGAGPRPVAEATQGPGPEPSETGKEPERRWPVWPGLATLLVAAAASWAGFPFVWLPLAVVGVVWLLMWLYLLESRPRQAGRKPYRSRVLGTVLKCLGVAIITWWFWGRFEWFDELLQLQRPGLVYFAWMINLAVYGLGIRIVVRGYQLSGRTFDPGYHPDVRPPILYLRGFDTDGQLSLQPDTFLARIHGIFPKWDKKEGQAESWRPRGGLLYFNPLHVLRMVFNIGVDSAAEVFALGFSRCGPLVAIGRPGEALALPGADQMFVTDERWQQVVLDYLDRCQAVLLIPSNSDGVRWEIDQVFTRVPLHRILLSMSAIHGKPGEYGRFRARLWAGHQIRLPIEAPVTGNPFFVYFERDGAPRLQELCLQSPVLWPFTGNAVNTRRTFRSFIQGLADGDREAPAEPQSYPGHGLASLVVAAGLVAALICLPDIWEYMRHHMKVG